MDLTDLIKTIWPLIAIQLALQIYAIVDIIRKRKTKNLSIAAWIVIIVVGELVGAALYLILGRSEE